METAQLARPVRGNLTRTERLFIFGLVAILTLGFASPAQAGLGDLIDGLLDPVEELPAIGEIVDPVVEEVADPVVGVVEPILAPVVDPVVDPIVEDVFTPAAEDVIAPIVEPVVEEVVDPVVDEVAPVVEDVVHPVLDEGAPPVLEEVVLPPIESVASSGPSLAWHTEQMVTDVDHQGSLVLAHALQTDLVGTAAAPPTVAGRLADSTGAGWLMGLTDWLRGTANGLADLLSIPLRLLELLARALLTAGSGLVAPASLALAFTIYAVRDRRWQRIRKTALN